MAEEVVVAEWRRGCDHVTRPQMRQGTTPPAAPSSLAASVGLDTVSAMTNWPAAPSSLAASVGLDTVSAMTNWPAAPSSLAASVGLDTVSAIIIYGGISGPGHSDCDHHLWRHQRAWTQ